MGSNEIGILVGVIVIAAIIGAISRELFCWYWKINLRVTLLEDISRKLSVLTGDKIPKSNMGFKESAEKLPSQKQSVDCPSCGAKTSSDGIMCEHCGADL